MAAPGAITPTGTSGPRILRIRHPDGRRAHAAPQVTGCALSDAPHCDSVPVPQDIGGHASRKAYYCQVISPVRAGESVDGSAYPAMPAAEYDVLTFFRNAD